MLKCAPYIKNLCSSLQSGLWKDSDRPASLPGSPIKRAKQYDPPSPTRSEGGAGTWTEKVPREVHQQVHPGVGQMGASSMPMLVVTSNLDGSEVITTSVKSTSTLELLKKLQEVNPRPESPDVTRAAKKLELSNSLGAISKVRNSPTKK